MFAARMIQRRAHGLEIGAIPDKGLHDAGDAVFRREGQVQKIRLRHRGRMQGAAGQGKTLAALQDAAAQNLCPRRSAVAGDDLKQELSVVQQYLLPRNETGESQGGDRDAALAEQRLIAFNERKRMRKRADAQLRPLHVDQKLCLFSALQSCALQIFNLQRRVV